MVGRRRRRAPISRALLVNESRELFLNREGYNRLATNLAFARPDSLPKVLVVTSPQPGEGKTTVAVNLAMTIAEHGARILLIDADLRRGRVAALLGVPQEPGLAEVLLGGIAARSVIHQVQVGSASQISVMPGGRTVHNPPALLGNQLESLLRVVREDFETIIIDSPPVNVIADAAVIGARSDGVLLVARAAVTNRRALAYAVDQLRHVGAPVLGAVLNDVDYRRHAEYDEAYEYYQEYARGNVYARPSGS
jgi:capsular exopolysaccharide synthesis family protein